MKSRRQTAAPAAYDQRKPAERVVVRLTVPPSTNALHANRKGGGYRLSDAYAAWLCQAGWRLNEQRPGRIVGGYIISIYLPVGTGIDQGNAEKALSDLLQMHGIIRNDCEAEETHLYWHRGEDVLVDVRPFVGPSRHAREVAA